MQGRDDCLTWCGDVFDMEFARRNNGGTVRARDTEDRLVQVQYMSFGIRSAVIVISKGSISIFFYVHV